jgi:hypothetical protein
MNRPLLGLATGILGALDLAKHFSRSAFSLDRGSQQGMGHPFSTRSPAIVLASPSLNGNRAHTGVVEVASGFYGKVL